VAACVLFEDDDLLVVNKPAGLNTHAPSPYAGEGLYDWLRHRERRWATLAIMQRLDKETSGVLVFPKTEAANRSLAEQFAGLLWGSLMVGLLLGVTERPSSREITRRAGDATAAFLRLHLKPDHAAQSADRPTS